MAFPCVLLMNPACIEFSVVEHPDFVADMILPWRVVLAIDAYVAGLDDVLKPCEAGGTRFRILQQVLTDGWIPDTDACLGPFGKMLSPEHDAINSMMRAALRDPQDFIKRRVC